MQINSDKSKFEQTMNNAFKLAHVPLVIDKTSFFIQNKYQFYIQIEIIFDIYSDTIDTFYLKQTKEELFNRCVLLLHLNLQNDDFKPMFDRCCQQSRDFIYSKYIKSHLDKMHNFLAENDYLNKYKNLLIEEKYIQEFLEQNENYQKNKILCDFDTYIKLVFVTNEIDYEQKPILDESIFKKHNIPLIIDKNCLESCKLIENPPEAVFYQLQIIFNEYDLKQFKYHFKELFYQAIKLISNIEIPNYQDLALCIRAKNVSRILQIQRYRLSSHNAEYSEFAKFVYDSNTNKIEKPENFEQRIMKESAKPKSTPKKVQKTTVKGDNNIFTWESIKDNKYELKNGILIDNYKQSKNEWSNEMKQIEIFFKNPTDSLDFELFDKISMKDAKSKLHKFYYYDEEEQKWKMNLFVIEQFFKEKFINDKMQTKIFFFVNSYEKDEIPICSRIINGLYPDFEDNEIFVYAICDKTLLYLQYKINLIDVGNKSDIKPIFLALHIPEKKKNLPNISTILMEISIFLSFICDSKIVILNNESYLSQIELVKELNSIICNFNKIGSDKSKQIPIDGMNFLSFSSKDIIDLDEEENVNEDEYDDDQNSDEYKDDEEDDYENDESQNINSKDDEMIYNRKFNFFLAFNDNLFKKQPNTIFLINDEKIKNILPNFEYKEKDSNLHSYISQQIQNSLNQIGHINVNDSFTYNWFLNTVQNFCQKGSYSSKEAFSNLRYVLMTEMSSMYIKLRRNPNWQSELKEIIDKRFESLKNIDYGKSTDFLVLTKLFSELSLLYPLIDTEFDNECIKIIRNHINEILKQKSDIYKKELQISSENNISCIDKMIFNEQLLTITNKRNIINNHVEFLKKEFFDIIKYFSPINEITALYAANIEIVEKQIDSDTGKINEIFKKFDEHIETYSKRQSTEDKIEIKVNYFVTEVENTNETEVLVDANTCLEDIIQQDF